MLRTPIIMNKTKFIALFISAVLMVPSVAVAAGGSPENPPVEISNSVVDALAAGDLNGAIIAMREEKSSPKLLYLIREVTRLSNFETEEKPDKAEAHKVYQNVAVSYHNLYLFLKSRGIEQNIFLEQAHKYYKKARNAGTLLHKVDCDVLDAAITAASGDIEKAKKRFSKIDEDLMRGDFESLEYLAAYRAATGDVDATIGVLREAYRLKPDSLLTWLAVGDDFYSIEEDPRFKELLISWKASEAEKKLSLSIPRASSPKLEVKDETGIFRPQKAMPHYDLKKSKAKNKETSKAKNKVKTKSRTKIKTQTNSSIKK